MSGATGTIRRVRTAPRVPTQPGLSTGYPIKRRGGERWCDPSLAPSSSLDWYRRVAAVSSWARASRAGPSGWPCSRVLAALIGAGGDGGRAGAGGVGGRGRGRGDGAGPAGQRGRRGLAGGVHPGDLGVEAGFRYSGVLLLVPFLDLCRPACCRSTRTASGPRRATFTAWFSFMSNTWPCRVLLDVRVGQGGGAAGDVFLAPHDDRRNCRSPGSGR